MLGAKTYYYTLTWMYVVKKMCINSDKMCSLIILIYTFLIISEVSNIFPMFACCILFEIGPDYTFYFAFFFDQILPILYFLWAIQHRISPYEGEKKSWYSIVIGLDVQFNPRKNTLELELMCYSGHVPGTVLSGWPSSLTFSITLQGRCCFHYTFEPLLNKLKI